MVEVREENCNLKGTVSVIACNCKCVTLNHPLEGISYVRKGKKPQ